MAAYEEQAKQYRAERMNLVKRWAKRAVPALLVLLILPGSCYTVDAGAKGVQTRFGSIIAITDPGFHLKAPWIDSVYEISTRTRWMRWSTDGKHDGRMEAYSHDQQPAMMSVQLSYRVKADPESVRRIYQQFHTEEGFESAILAPRVGQAVKTSFGQFTAVSVIQDRIKFNREATSAVEIICNRIDDRDSPVVIEGVQIYDIQFSQSYIHAVEQRMQAQVEVEKVAQNLERERKSAEIVVVQAKAEADANVAKARAQGESARLVGEGEASAIRARAAALQQNPYLIQLTQAEKWDGKLPTTMPPGGTVPFLSVGDHK